MSDEAIREEQGGDTIKVRSSEMTCIKNVLYVLDLDASLLSVG